MDRKPGRGTQIFALTLFTITMLTAVAPARAAGGSALDGELRRQTSALDSIKAALENGREKLSQLKKEEAGYVAQLAQLENNIALSRDYLGALNKKIDALDADIVRQSASLDDATRALRNRQQVLYGRLRAIYKQPNPSLIRIVLTSQNMADVLRRVRYFQDLNHYDRILVAAIDSSRAGISREKLALERRRALLLALAADKEHERQALVHEQTARTAILGEVRSQKSAFLAMVRQLEEDQRAIIVLIKKLQSQKRKPPVKKAAPVKGAPATGALAKFQGSLPWPCVGRVVRAFGKIVHPVYKTVTVNNGIDIAGHSGQKVYAVAPGTVMYVGWMRGMGKFAIVDHGDQYLTIYAHCQDISVRQDEAVTPATAVGVLGDADVSGPMLHFEIRLSTAALDPLEWLQKR
ncbi:MAG: peptidoglycan DD-metalloendopeptidase family protein [Chitinivibrionales bacterium]|nr:peptidoglycan DD-metalloendopeptidase family protein [Chitinivibrionales bacterium]